MNEFKQIRKDLGLSQSDVAEFIGVKRLSVSKWENSNEAPFYALLSIKQLKALKSKLEIIKAFDAFMESMK